MWGVDGAGRIPTYWPLTPLERAMRPLSSANAPIRPPQLASNGASPDGRVPDHLHLHESSSSDSCLSMDSGALSAC